MKDYKHNVILISSEVGQAAEYIRSLYEHDKGVLSGPDFVEMKKSRFSISDARDLERVLMSSGFARGLVVAIYAQSIGQEAQNALLKLFEDLPQKTTVFFVVPNMSTLLSTLTSRMQAVHLPNRHSDRIAKMFLSKSVPERLKFLQQLQKKEDFPQQANELADSLTEHFRAQKEFRKLSSVLTLRRYVNSSVGPVKPSLEELAFL